MIHFEPTLGERKGKGTSPTGAVGAAVSFPRFSLCPASTAVAAIEHWVTLSLVCMLLLSSALYIYISIYIPALFYIPAYA
jgi:hypothetical protein